MKSTDKDLICPVCDEGRLQLLTHIAQIDYEGNVLNVEGMEYCECPVCDADPVLTDQILRNERRVADAKRRAMGMLVSDQIKAIRKRLGLTQREASELFGGGANSFSKYERGAVLQSTAMDTLLKLLAVRPDMMGFIKLLKGKPLNDSWLHHDWIDVPESSLRVVAVNTVSAAASKLPDTDGAWSDVA